MSKARADVSYLRGQAREELQGILECNPLVAENCTRQCLGMPLFVAGLYITAEMVGLSQVTLAGHIGVPVQRIKEIVRGKRDVTSETA